MKGKKLPDVWVNFSPNNIPCLVTLSKARAAAAILPSCRETVHRYTTANNCHAIKDLKRLT